MKTEALEFVSKMGRFFESIGLDHASGRVLGFLFMTAPDEQSALDIINALAMSRGAVSMATRGLEQRSYVEVRGEVGSRKKYYRLRQEAWTIGIEDRAKVFAQFAEIADFGATNVPDVTEISRRRLEEVRDFYRFLEDRFPQLVDEWEYHKSRKND